MARIFKYYNFFQKNWSVRYNTQIFEKIIFLKILIFTELIDVFGKLNVSKLWILWQIEVRFYSICSRYRLADLENKSQPNKIKKESSKTYKQKQVGKPFNNNLQILFSSRIITPLLQSILMKLNSQELPDQDSPNSGVASQDSLIPTSTDQMIKLKINVPNVKPHLMIQPNCLIAKQIQPLVYLKRNF